MGIYHEDVRSVSVQRRSVVDREARSATLVPVLVIDDPAHFPDVIQADERQMLAVAPVRVTDSVERQRVIAAGCDLEIQGVVGNRLGSAISLAFEMQLLPRPRRGVRSRSLAGPRRA